MSPTRRKSYEPAYLQSISLLLQKFVPRFSSLLLSFEDLLVHTCWRYIRHGCLATIAALLQWKVCCYRTKDEKVRDGIERLSTLLRQIISNLRTTNNGNFAERFRIYVFHRVLSYIATVLNLLATRPEKNSVPGTTVHNYYR